jgi:hypothetical protein
LLEVWHIDIAMGEFEIQIVLAILVLVGIVAAALWERRPVQPYIVPPAGDEYQPTQKANSENSEAERLGYKHIGLAHDGKGWLYRVRYDFWIAPDNSTIVIVGGGTVALLPVDAVWLWSRCTNGQILCTTNAVGEQDISGIVQQETWPHMSLASLVDAHTLRLGGLSLQLFSKEDPLRGHFEVRQAISDALVERNYAYYITNERLEWRYTLKGAFAFYIVARWIRPIRRFLRGLGALVWKAR